MGAITREVLDNDDSLGLHPLRASCGRVELDTALLSESIAHTLEWVNGSSSIGQGTVLARLQQAIAGEHQSDARVQVPLNDDSIQFHSCHGARRQVEVLRDTLLHLFERYDGIEEHEALQPRHVNVLVSDLEAYAPLIEAVFSQGWQRRPTAKPVAETGAPKIEIAMVGRSFRNVNSVADALLRLLDLAGLGERMSASDVMGLLSLPPVLARFGMTGEDLAQIQTWIDQTGIRWGMDGQHRSEIESVGDWGASGEEQPLRFGAVDANAWVLGLEQLLLGVVLADDGEVIFDDDERLGLIPFDDMEGDRVRSSVALPMR